MKRFYLFADVFEDDDPDVYVLDYKPECYIDVCNIYSFASELITSKNVDREFFCAVDAESKAQLIAELKRNISDRIEHYKACADYAEKLLIKM